jgi:hypothetical protein
VSAEYLVLISDELIASGLTWPAGMRLASPLPAVSSGPDPLGLPYGLPHARWYRVEDDEAPPELEGCPVELVFRVANGKPVLAERRVIP